MMSGDKKDIGDVFADIIVKFLRTAGGWVDKVLPKNKQGKKIYNLIIALAVIVVLALAYNLMNNATKPKAAMSTEDENVPVSETVKDDLGGYRNTSYKAREEKKLIELISLMINGGEIQVAIRVDGSEEKVIAKNTIRSESVTDEEDTNGGKREIKTNQYTNTVVTLNEGNETKALVTKVLEPKVLSVVTVIGKNIDSETMAELKMTIMKLYGLRAEQVEVFASKR